MLNLLAAERIKLTRSKKLLIVFGILFFFPIYQAVNSKIMAVNGKELVQVVDTVINGATGILMIDKNGLTILLVISAFISFFIGEEFQNGTIRNALSLGRSRIHFYLSKLVTAALVTLIGVMMLTILGMISFSVAFGFGEVSGIDNYLSFAFQAFGTLYLLILANVSIYVMFSFITKNSGPALIWSFVYTIGTGFGAPIFLETEHFQQLTYWFTETFLFYSDLTSADEIARYPEMAMTSLITVVVSSAIGIMVFNRTDIK